MTSELEGDCVRHAIEQIWPKGNGMGRMIVVFHWSVTTLNLVAPQLLEHAEEFQRFVGVHTYNIRVVVASVHVRIRTYVK